MIGVVASKEVHPSSIPFQEVICALAQAHYSPQIELNKVDLPRLSPAQAAAPTNTSAKVRINTYSVEAIAKVFAALSEWVKANSDVHGLGIVKRDEAGQSQLVALTSDQLASELAMQKGKFGRILYLEGRTHSVLSHFVRSAFGSASDNDGVYDKYDREMNAAIGYLGYSNPHGHLSSGVSTGTSIMFGIAYAVVEIIDRIAASTTHPDKLRAEAFRRNESDMIEFLSHALSSALALSKIQVGALSALEAAYFSNKALLAKILTVDFSGSKPRLKMFSAAAEKFIEHGVDALNAGHTVGATWTNCPATRAMVDNNTVATAFLRDWVRDLVGAFVIEHVEGLSN